MAGNRTRAMIVEHRDKLQSNVVNLVSDLILSEDLVAVLLRGGVLTPCIKEDIEAKKTRSAKVRELVTQILPRRSDDAYYVFIEALVESRQDHLAILIDPAVADEYIKKRDENVDLQLAEQAARTASVDSYDIVCRAGSYLMDSDIWYKKLFEAETKDIDVAMRQLTEYRKTFIEDQMTSRKAYRLDKSGGQFYGRAIVINNTEYDYENPRPGSEHDSTNLEKLFKDLHFDVCVYKDLTGKQMTEVLKAEAGLECHHRYSMFVLCILAHGGQNKVYGVDFLSELSIGAVEMSEIMSWFNATNCRGLAGKPKLMFIQACQGSKDMLSVSLSQLKDKNLGADGVCSMDTDAIGDAQHLNPQPTGATAWQQLPNGYQLPSGQQPSAGQQLHIPEVADFLVAYSTAPGYRSWRHPQYGAWFIRCLIYVIRSNACEDHIVDILTQVAFIISHFKVKYRSTYSVQVPQIVSTLTKKVFFMP